MIRAFLALDLPETVRTALTVQQFLLPLPRRADPAAFHLTLVFLGEVAPQALEAAHEAFQELRIAPFTLTLAGLGLFGGGRPRVAWAGVQPCEALMRLQVRAEQAARRAGLAPEARRFVPHVTLGRFPPPPPAQSMALERAVAEGAGFRAGPFPVTGMVLYESRRLPQGPRYQPLAAYPFGAG
jgi:2'-5' RNA ligase